jgi:uncharacterized protein YegP (UPF0339 family)
MSGGSKVSTFLVYTDREGKYRWCFQSNNYRTIADSGEGYDSKESCLHGIRVFKRNEGSYQAYEDASGEHRWRFRARNGRMIAHSAEGYVSDSNCQRAIGTVKREVAHAHTEG